jgi:hypothetical protein
MNVQENAPEQVTLPAPVVGSTRPSSKWETEYQAFLRLLPELLKTHRGKYVAFHNEQMVDSDTDEIALTLRVLRKNGNVPIHVDLVTEQPPPVYRVPHYWLYRPGASE